MGQLEKVLVYYISVLFHTWKNVNILIYDVFNLK
jgi:hypothetical protein